MLLLRLLVRSFRQISLLSSLIMLVLLLLLLVVLRGRWQFIVKLMVLRRQIMIVIVLDIVVSSIMFCVISVLGLVAMMDCIVLWLVILSLIGRVSVVVVISYVGMVIIGMIARIERLSIFSKLFFAKEGFKWSSKLKVIVSLPSVGSNKSNNYNHS